MSFVNREIQKENKEQALAEFDELSCLNEEADMQMEKIDEDIRTTL